MTPRRRTRTDVFDGWIAGLGTASGLRLVIGRWPRSPFGPFADVMVERRDGHRILIAPTEEIAGYVAATYRFDEVRVAPVHVAVLDGWWRVTAGPAEVVFRAGRRTPLGLLLRAVPRRLATRPAWIRLAGRVGRRLLPGVRTHGSAQGGRRELYAALDLHRIADAAVQWEGVDQGAPGPVLPPVRFGFGSTPAGPAVVRIVTRVVHPPR